MKATVKRLWVRALRSGKYEQGRGLLRDGDTFCCLGVLCDLYLKEHKYSAIDLHGFYLPRSVRRWAGLASGNPEVRPRKVAGIRHDTLASLNDAGRSFARIATIIEKEL